MPPYFLQRPLAYVLGFTHRPIPAAIIISLTRISARLIDADLCSGINLSLPSVLSLSQDSSSHQLVPVLFADEVCSFEKDGRAIAPWHSFPPSLGSKGAIDGPRHGCLICLVIRTNVARMVRRNQLLSELAGLDLCNYAIRCTRSYEYGD